MDANCSQRIQFLGDSSVPASLANLYFFALKAPARPCRSTDATAHRRSPRALPGDALGRRTRESGRSSIRALRQGGRNASLVCIKHAALTNFLTARRHRAHPPSDYDGILALSAGSDYAQLCAYGRRRAVLCEKPSYYGYGSSKQATAVRSPHA